MGNFLIEWENQPSYDMRHATFGVKLHYYKYMAKEIGVA